MTTLYFYNRLSGYIIPIQVTAVHVTTESQESFLVRTFKSLFSIFIRELILMSDCLIYMLDVVIYHATDMSYVIEQAIDVSYVVSDQHRTPTALLTAVGVNGVCVRVGVDGVCVCGVGVVVYVGVSGVDVCICFSYLCLHLIC